MCVLSPVCTCTVGDLYSVTVKETWGFPILGKWGRMTFSSGGCCDESSHWPPRCQHSEYAWRWGIFRNHVPNGGLNTGWILHLAQFAASVLPGTIAHTEIWIAPKKMRKSVRSFHLNIRKHFHRAGDIALAQVAQRGCGVSHLGDTQKPSGHGPGQPALGGPAWAGGLDLMTSRGPL